MENGGETILVTGVTGTLGGSMAAYFLDKGYCVKGLVRDKEHILSSKCNGMEVVIGELEDIDSLRVALQGVDIIIHCAAYLGEEMEKAIASNIKGVKNICEASLSEGVQRFLHISTLSVFGEPNDGYFSENCPIAIFHDEPYVYSKIESEKIVKQYGKKGLPFVILRPGSICAETNSYWGDRQVLRMIKADAITWVHRDDMVAFVHRDNLIEMAYIAVFHPKAINQVFHAIDGNFPEYEYRVRLAKSLNKVVKTPERAPQRPLYSNNLLFTLLGYQQKKSFYETMVNLETIGKKFQKKVHVQLKR